MRLVQPLKQIHSKIIGELKNYLIFKVQMENNKIWLINYRNSARKFIINIQLPKINIQKILLKTHSETSQQSQQLMLKNLNVWMN